MDCPNSYFKLVLNSFLNDLGGRNFSLANHNYQFFAKYLPLVKRCSFNFYVLLILIKHLHFLITKCIKVKLFQMSKYPISQNHALFSQLCLFRNHFFRKHSKAVEINKQLFPQGGSGYLR